MQQNQPAIPAPATPAPANTIAPQALAVPVSPATAQEMYEAMRTQRRVIEDQLQSQLSDRDEIVGPLRAGAVTGADRDGMEARLRTTDARITELQGQLARAEAQEAAAAGLPGATTDSPQEQRQELYQGAMAVGSMLLFVFAIPMSIAWARRAWRKNAVTIVLPPELTNRLDAIERSVETTAIEVERIGEGQRFVTQLMAARSDAGALPVARAAAREASRDVGGGAASG